MTKKPNRQPKRLEQPRTVRLKPHSYQPSKAEQEAPIDIRRPDGSRPTPEELADAVLRPVRIVEDADA